MSTLWIGSESLAMAILNWLLKILIMVACVVVSPAFAERVDTLHNFSRNGITLFLQESFDDEFRSPAKTILLVHGLTYSSHEFDVRYKDYSLVDRLTKEGYTTWLMDIAGYGRSGNVNDGFTIDSDYAAKDIAEAVAYILKTKKTKPHRPAGMELGYGHRVKNGHGRFDRNSSSGFVCPHYDRLGWRQPHSRFSPQYLGACRRGLSNKGDRRN